MCFVSLLVLNRNIFWSVAVFLSSNTSDRLQLLTCYNAIAFTLTSLENITMAIINITDYNLQIVTKFIFSTTIHIKHSL